MKTCQKSSNLQCDDILSPLTFRYNEIKREFDSISHLMSKRNKRSAWFAGIGTVFKHVFGTLDEDDASKYDSAIESFQNHEKKLAELMKENILITTTSLESYKETINKLKYNEVSLKNTLSQLLLQLNNITETSKILISETKFYSILANLESSLLALSFQLEDITNAILLCSQNILHPNIISPTQLYYELVDNDRHLPRDTGIPVTLSLDNIHLILSISEVACYYYKNKLVFVLQIPLVTNDEFILYHNLALPTPHGSTNPNTFSLILPSSSYIAISKDKLNFCNLDTLDKCKTMYSEFFLCEIPTVLLTSVSPTCESELLTKTISAIPTQCETKTIVGELDIWKSLINNQWIFVQSRSSKVSMDCNNSELREMIVSGTGILRIPNQCTVYTKSAKLISSKDSINVEIPIPRLDFSIINDPCCKLDNKSTTSLNNIISPILLQNIDLDDLTLKKQNNKLYSDLNKLINEEPILVKYGTHYSILTICILVILISFMSFKLCKIICKHRSKFYISCVKPMTHTDDDVSNYNISTEPENSSIPLPRLRDIV